ncbi:MAG TPA: SagB/ThcOx family dehydrogenase [Fibrobacteria bacterium]|nr:SagB/ThcOx family dehydrogenase [Fibrobacteria bacterium]HOX51684.1 SagB/ThcOx family dehydrogenase [Fibrobacteria bacterium]
MASFLERYHELTKYDPRTIEHSAGADWQAQPQAWKTIQGKEHLDIREHLGFLAGFADENGSGHYPSPSPRLDLATLSRISWFASGVSAMGGSPQDSHLYRTNPSAGGLYPVEHYWIVLDVDGMEPGVWQFHAPGFALVPVWKGDFRAEVSTALFGAADGDEVAAVAVLTGIFSRGSWRYGERAYRRILLDAGHLEGNLLEAVHREDLDSNPLSGFCDAALSELLFPDEDEVPLLAITVGKNVRGAHPRSLRSPEPDPTELQASVPPGLMQRKAHHLARIPASGPSRDEGVSLPTRRAGLAYMDLPSPRMPQGIVKAAVDRRSCRAFAWAPATVEQLSSLLAWSRIPPSKQLSPPGLLDTWIVVNAVLGLDSGIYHWDGDTHTLACVRVGEYREDSLKMCLGQELGGNASFLVVHTSPLALAVESLGERAYRPLCMDAGHFGERLNLAAQAMGLGASGIGGYFDDMVNETIGQPLTNAVLYVTTVGEPG